MGTNDTNSKRNVQAAIKNRKKLVEKAVENAGENSQKSVDEILAHLVENGIDANFIPGVAIAGEAFAACFRTAEIVITKMRDDYTGEPAPFGDVLKVASAIYMKVAIMQPQQQSPAILGAQRIPNMHDFRSQN